MNYKEKLYQLFRHLSEPLTILLLLGLLLTSGATMLAGINFTKLDKASPAPKPRTYNKDLLTETNVAGVATTSANLTPSPTPNFSPKLAAFTAKNSPSPKPSTSVTAQGSSVSSNSSPSPSLIPAPTIIPTHPPIIFVSPAPSPSGCAMGDPCVAPAPSPSISPEQEHCHNYDNCGANPGPTFQ